MTESKDTALIVDLDNSFLQTDLLHEALVDVVKRKPWKIFWIVFFALRGPLALKKYLVGEWKQPRFEILPVCKEVKAFIAKEKQTRPVILLSASPDEWVQGVAKVHSKYFDGAYGSTNINLKSSQKLSFIKDTLRLKTFSYVGDSVSDVPIWKNCERIICVWPSLWLRAKVEKMKKSTIYIQQEMPLWRSLARSVRLYQWVKNGLVFLPIIAAHTLTVEKISVSAIAFLNFSFVAAIVYIFNDLIDLNADRQHSTKKNRPFASGNLPLYWAGILVPLLAVGSVFLAMELPIEFTYTLFAYLGMNLVYSFYFKKVIIADVVLLSCMFTVRILAGGAASDTPISGWMLGFSVLFFFSLANVKRCSEIIRHPEKTSLEGRGYIFSDFQPLFTIGACSGLLSVVILSIYLQSSNVRALYTHPQLLWLFIPLFLYFFSRTWLLVSRNQIHDDPVLFVLRDKASWIVIFLMAVILMGASI